MKLVIPTAAERSAAVDIKGITNKRAYDFLIPVEIRQSNITTYKKYMTPRSYWSRHPIRRRIIPAESARALNTRGSCHHQESATNALCEARCSAVMLVTSR